MSSGMVPQKTAAPKPVPSPGRKLTLAEARARTLKKFSGALRKLAK